MVTPDLLEQFTEINKALDQCCELALKQPLPNKQIALMTDASFSVAGYAVLIEDDPMEKYSSMRKAFARVGYGSKTFSPAQLKMPIYAKEFLAIFFAFKEFGHIFWGTPKSVIILTVNKSVTRIFQNGKNHSHAKSGKLCGMRVTTLSSSISRLPIYQTKTTPQLTTCLA